MQVDAGSGGTFYKQEECVSRRHPVMTSPTLGRHDGLDNKIPAIKAT